MKIQRITGVNGENERTAKGLQLTRVVPPSFSVPLWESRCWAFFYAQLLCKHTSIPELFRNGARAL